MKRQNVRTLSLIVVTFTYLLIGAAVFDALESDFEVTDCKRLSTTEQFFVRKYNISEEDMRSITTTIIKFVPHRAGTQWKFAGAFFFSTTVITTIGFGYSTPKTVGGKVFCMFYALVGIPLNLIMFQSIGERLNIFVTFVLRHFKKCFRFKSSEVSQTNLIFVCINMSSIVVAGGAYAFSRIEGWSYLDAFYYCIITLTTIGFGDYVALQRNEDLQHKPQYFIFSLLFILFGLAILSAAMNLLVLRFLTLNTEDERKDELEALAAIRSAVRLDGDVITSNNSLLSPYLFNHRPTSFVNQSTNAYFPAQLPSRSPLQPIESMHSTSMEQPMIGMVDQDRVSVCSCTCYNFKNNLRKRSKKGSIFQTISHSLSSRQSRGESTAANSFIAQLLQPVKVLQAMSQVHANKNNEDWRVQNTVFGQRRNSA